MAIEYEMRTLGVSIDEIINKLQSIGAEYIGSYHQKRFVYDFKPAVKGRWIRLRSNGIVSTLTIKEIKSLRVDGTNELEIVVSDFDETNRIINKLGFSPRTFQENFRIEYRLNNVNYDIDKWPGIPPFMEIEGDSEKSVFDAINYLGMTIDSFTTMDVDTIYNGVYGINLDSISQLRFSDEELGEIHKYSE